jgi:hypothetical protein
MNFLKSIRVRSTQRVSPKIASMIEIAIFPSGKLRRPKEKLETIARQEVLARMAALSTDGMAV